ncbi:Folate carrier domain containing protein [Asbolus verrucosus]|uniref:Folate carrier domain containing protein n=1 Tax=Asbolus verrucosus TaxID=1661398 RepID=A0A482W8B4_ASBVE|nr:Folate carrier domain containing protein [Asbolus verrucosus]
MEKRSFGAVFGFIHLTAAVINSLMVYVINNLYKLEQQGFFANSRPANPFIYEYYITFKKLPGAEVRRDILPTFSYSSAIQLLFVFLFYDFCHYNPFIVISSISAIVATCVFAGTSAATELAYYISIYSYYEVTDYQKITSYVRAIPLAAKTVSTLLELLVTQTKWMEHYELLYLNLACK